MPQTPYISFVLAGRNDDYGGDFRQRLQDCISRLYDQLLQTDVSSEIIFVNYNPLAESSIEDFIAWPSSTGKLSMRIITVPEALHRTFISAHGLKDVPVVEYLAKNAGIRRSKGLYIACVNPDIRFPDELFRKIAAGLDPHAYYKANRLDFRFGNKGYEYVRMNLKGHAFGVKAFSPVRNWWWKLRYFFINRYKFLSPKLRYLFDLMKITVYYHNAEFRYHCIAGGDLMLMSSASWHSLGGYHEKNRISLHTDSLMTIQAASYGLKERVLRDPLLHREHERRFTSDSRDPAQEQAYLFFQQEAVEMLHQKKNKIYNTDDWGLIKFELPEIIVE